jgi:hypothetical protein
MIRRDARVIASNSQALSIVPINQQNFDRTFRLTKSTISAQAAPGSERKAILPQY